MQMPYTIVFIDGAAKYKKRLAWLFRYKLDKYIE